MEASQPETPYRENETPKIATDIRPQQLQAYSSFLPVTPSSPPGLSTTGTQYMALLNDDEFVLRVHGSKSARDPISGERNPKETAPLKANAQVGRVDGDPRVGHSCDEDGSGEAFAWQDAAGGSEGRNRASRFARRDERASSTARRVSGGASLVRRAGRALHRSDVLTKYDRLRIGRLAPVKASESAPKRKEYLLRGGHPRRPGAALQIWRG
jgi:hypothetical protein